MAGLESEDAQKLLIIHRHPLLLPLFHTPVFYDVKTVLVFLLGTALCFHRSCTLSGRSSMSIYYSIRPHILEQIGLERGHLANRDNVCDPSLDTLLFL